MTEPSSASDTNPKKIVAFRLGDEEYGIDILAVREIRSWTPTTAIPRSPAYVRGVINLRGAVLPVVDLGARLGMELREVSKDDVIIVIESNGRLIGLLVDAVSDILMVDDGNFLPTPEVPSADIARFIASVVTIDDRMIQLVATSSILEDGSARAA